MDVQEDLDVNNVFDNEKKVVLNSMSRGLLWVCKQRSFRYYKGRMIRNIKFSIDTVT